MNDLGKKVWDEIPLHALAEVVQRHIEPKARL
jgi:hypothetical protein